VFLAERG